MARLPMARMMARTIEGPLSRGPGSHAPKPPRGLRKLEASFRGSVSVKPRVYKRAGAECGDSGRRVADLVGTGCALPVALGWAADVAVPRPGTVREPQFVRRAARDWRMPQPPAHGRARKVRSQPMGLCSGRCVRFDRIESLCEGPTG